MNMAREKGWKIEILEQKVKMSKDVENEKNASNRLDFERKC